MTSSSSVRVRDTGDFTRAHHKPRASRSVVTVERVNDVVVIGPRTRYWGWKAENECHRFLGTGLNTVVQHE